MGYNFSSGKIEPVRLLIGNNRHMEKWVIHGTDEQGIFYKSIYWTTGLSEHQAKTRGFLFRVNSSDQKSNDTFLNINGKPMFTKHLRKISKVKDQNKQKQTKIIQSDEEENLWNT